LSGAVAKTTSINLRKLVLSPTGSINLGFILRGDLLLCSSYLPLGVPNWAVIYTPSDPQDQQSSIYAQYSGKKNDVQREHQNLIYSWAMSHAQILTF
jgi:hypothetical protein